MYSKGMQKKLDKAVTDKNFPKLFEKILIKYRLDKIADKVDLIEDAARIIRENEQNLKDLSGLKHRLDLLDEIRTSIDKIAGNSQKYIDEQTLNSDKLSKHEKRFERIEKHLKLPAFA
jgi:uncharacterized lipoprotein YehR (DUF1307 family)